MTTVVVCNNIIIIRAQVAAESIARAYTIHTITQTRAHAGANTTGRTPRAGGPSPGRRDFFPRRSSPGRGAFFSRRVGRKPPRPAVVGVMRVPLRRRRYHAPHPPPTTQTKPRPRAATTNGGTVNQNPPGPRPATVPTVATVGGNRTAARGAVWRRPHAFCGIKTPAARKERVAGGRGWVDGARCSGLAVVARAAYTYYYYIHTQ